MKGNLQAISLPARGLARTRRAGTTLFGSLYYPLSLFHLVQFFFNDSHETMQNSIDREGKKVQDYNTGGS